LPAQAGVGEEAALVFCQQQLVARLGQRPSGLLWPIGWCPGPRATPADPGSPGCQPAAGWSKPTAVQWHQSCRRSSPTSRRSHPGHAGGRQGWIVAAVEGVGSGHPGGAGAAVEGSALRFLAVWLGLTAEVDPSLHATAQAKLGTDILNLVPLRRMSAVLFRRRATEGLTGENAVSPAFETRGSAASAGVHRMENANRLTLRGHGRTVRHLMGAPGDGDPCRNVNERPPSTRCE
jgi:hypothetical protein